MAEMTPMMRQYMEIKEQNKDSILFFRLGDFYEMFGDDARKASRELDLTLTTRDKDKNKSFEEKIPMCGIPYHASDAYIARLIAKGYKVAICEQTEDPAAAKGLVERDIVRIVTPGTVIDSACLEEGRSNFCAGIYLDGDYAGFSVCDISTGQTHVTAFSGPDREAHLQNELGRFAPAEAVLNPGAAEDTALRALLEDKLRCHVERLPAGRFQLPAAEKRIRQQFGDDAAQRLPRDNPAAMLALGALLDYLHDTQKTDLNHVDRLDYYRQGQFMELDLTARRNLELTETLRGKEKKGSLLWVLDKTRTAMGHRLIRGWLERPLLSPVQIARRQQAVIVLTTAGDDPDRTSIGWEVHEKCRRILAWRRGEPEREGDTDAPEWCPIMYGIGILTGDDPERIAELDIYDEALWYACNPGLGHNLKLRDFRADARAARQSEAAERWFRWLRLNQWISTKSVGWLPLTLYDKSQFNRPEWKALKAPERRQAVRDYLVGKRCFGGLDLSTTTDLTAFTLLFPPQEGLDTWVVLFWAWRPEEGVLEAEQRDHVPYRDWTRAGFLELCPGDMVDFTMVEDAVAAAVDVFDLDTLGVDPYLSRTLTPRLMERRVNVVEIPQDMKNLSPAMKEVERLTRAHQMLHEHNTAARWCFGNVRCAVDGNENIKPMKNRSIGRIDITVAWIIAMAVALLAEGRPPDLAEALSRPGYSL